MFSPLCFSLLFTNDFMINENDFKLIKYAEDMALVGLLHKSDSSGEAAYLANIKALQTWCHTSQLVMNVAKTKELILPMKQDMNLKPVSLTGQFVETVGNFKYLGTILDSQLSFSVNTEFTFKKCSQRLYLLRGLRSLSAIMC